MSDDIKTSYGYRMQGLCCGNCKHKATLDTPMCYLDPKQIFSVAETAICNNYKHYQAKERT